jgi:hypothetical protein
MPDPISAIAGSAVLGAGSSLIGSSKAADAQREAAAQSAAAQREGADKSIAAQREMFDIGRADLAPYREGGVTAQNQLMQLLGIGGDQNAPEYGRYAKDFGAADFTASPGYQFSLDQGLRAIKARDAAQGRTFSGANDKGILDYATGKASGEYQNAFNNYMTSRNARLGSLQSLYAGGQASAAGSAAQAGTLGQNLGQTYTGLGQGLAQAAVAGGNAQASGYINQANAVTNALNQGMSSYMMNNYLGSMGGRGGGGSFLSPSQGGSGLI